MVRIRATFAWFDIGVTYLANAKYRMVLPIFVCQFNVARVGGIGSGVMLIFLHVTKLPDALWVKEMAPRDTTRLDYPPRRARETTLNACTRVENVTHPGDTVAVRNGVRSRGNLKTTKWRHHEL